MKLNHVEYKALKLFQFDLTAMICEVPFVCAFRLKSFPLIKIIIAPHSNAI